MKNNYFYSFVLQIFIATVAVLPAAAAYAHGRPGFDDEDFARPPVHVKGEKNQSGPSANRTPTGLSPAQTKSMYNLPSTGGAGTIAIVDAYDDPNVENDLNAFSTQFGLPQCTTANGCFKKVAYTGSKNSSWALEESLDAEWAHAIAPNAKILLVEARSASGNDLLAAVNYARTQAGVTAVSMSWGGAESSNESSYDSYFTGPNGMSFFASSGDSGAGVEWPAVSPNVTGVGGTTLNFSNGQLVSETAWSGSGGGLSTYVAEPAYQKNYNVPGANNFRAVPDVSYNADPNSGFSVYDSYGYYGTRGWFVVGGTSAGAPQWAAIKALGTGAANATLYADASSLSVYGSLFRDVLSGTNGSCGFYCTAASGYDYVTGLGSPLTVNF